MYFFKIGEVTSPLGQSILSRSSKSAGAALEAMKSHKMSKHFRPCQANGVGFVPLVAETLGGWDADAVFHLRAIANGQGAASSSAACLRNLNFIPLAPHCFLLTFCKRLS